MLVEVLKRFAPRDTIFGDLWQSIYATTEILFSP